MSGREVISVLMAVFVMGSMVFMVRSCDGEESDRNEIMSILDEMEAQ